MEVFIGILFTASAIVWSILALYGAFGLDLSPKAKSKFNLLKVDCLVTILAAKPLGYFEGIKVRRRADGEREIDGSLYSTEEHYCLLSVDDKSSSFNEDTLIFMRYDGVQTKDLMYQIMKVKNIYNGDTYYMGSLEDPDLVSSYLNGISEKDASSPKFGTSTIKKIAYKDISYKALKKKVYGDKVYGEKFTDSLTYILRRGQITEIKNCDGKYSKEVTIKLTEGEYTAYAILDDTCCGTDWIGKNIYIGLIDGYFDNDVIVWCNLYSEPVITMNNFDPNYVKVFMAYLVDMLLEARAGNLLVGSRALDRFSESYEWLACYNEVKDRIESK